MNIVKKLDEWMPGVGGKIKTITTGNTVLWIKHNDSFSISRFYVKMFSDDELIFSRDFEMDFEEVTDEIIIRLVVSCLLREADFAIKTAEDLDDYITKTKIF